MTEEQIKNYGDVNVKALADYTKNFLSEKPELNVPTDLKVGTILTQHWLNSTDYYRVVKTTPKTVTMKQIPDIQISFDHDGGGTGTRWHMPDFKNEGKDSYYNKECKKVVKFLAKGGFYIPGVMTGSWCGPMRIWDGTPCSDYYGD